MRKLFVFSGPSGAGKGTLLRVLIHRFPQMKLARSHTTRPMRPGEFRGVQYHFVSEDEFRQMIDRDEFAEWAQYPPETGNFYGTTREQLESDADTVIEIEIQGAHKIKAQYPDAILVFIRVDTETLRRRLLERGSLPEEELERRLQRAEEELLIAPEFYDHIVDNPDGTLEKPLLHLIAIVN